jgi:PhnB protein
MRVMVIVKATKESEAEIQPGDEKMLKEMGAFNEELVEAGIMLTGEGLKASRFGKRVKFSGNSRAVTDGPFTETKELIAGYWLWKVKSMEEAVKWVKRCPNPMPTESEIEIRPIYETEDFADVDPTGEIRKQEDELRKRIERQQTKV